MDLPLFAGTLIISSLGVYAFNCCSLFERLVIRRNELCLLDMRLEPGCELYIEDAGRQSGLSHTIAARGLAWPELVVRLRVTTPELDA